MTDTYTNSGLEDLLAHSDWSVRAQALDLVVYDDEWDWWAVLTDALLDEDPRVQAQAATNLSIYAPVEAVAVFLGLLQGASPQLQEAIANIFNDYDPLNLETGLNLALLAEDATIVSRALTLLRLRGETPETELLLEWLLDEQQALELRLGALDALFAIEPESATEQMIALLESSTNETLIAQCAFILARFNNEVLPELIFDRLQDASEALTINLLIVLQLLERDEYIKDVLTWLNDTQSAVRQQAFKTILALGADSQNDSLVEQVASLVSALSTDADAEIRRLALLNSGRFDMVGHWNILLEATHDPEWQVRLQAVIAAGWRYLDPENEEAAIYLQDMLPYVLQDEHWQVRAAAMLLLKLVPDVLEDDWVSPALGDPSAAVRQAAKLGPNQALYTPMALLNPQLRWLELCALTITDALGVDALADASSDEDPEVAEFAQGLSDLIAVTPRIQNV